MKNLIFYLAGVIFLFVSCQSDDLQIEEFSKPDHATKVTKEITFWTYEGEIYTDPVGDYLEQEGGGIASHIGKYTFVNTSTITGFLNPDIFVGVLTAANGDMIYYDAVGFDCGDYPVPCVGEDAIFKYVISGGTGRFEDAEGWLEYYGIWVQNGDFEGTGKGEITY